MLNMKKTTGAAREKWKARVDGFLDTFFERFYPQQHMGSEGSYNVMVEITCEAAKICNPDQASFKAYTSRWLAVTTQLCPWTADKIMPKIRESARGAARQCSGGPSGTICGQNWNSDTWDGFQGLGEQMSALSVIQSTLIGQTQKPITEDTGGLSKADGTAGKHHTNVPFEPITTADRVGAALFTFLVLISTLIGTWWLLNDDVSYGLRIITRIFR